MKYIIVLGDGMADRPVEELGFKTPLQAAEKPNIDFLARHGKLGMVSTIPGNMPPGSDVANLSVMGYNPEIYYTGRSPLEAVSMGINMGESDLSFRCNLVTLSENEKYEDKVMVDYSSDEISSQEAKVLIEEINRHLGCDSINFYPGISYRHCMIWEKGQEGIKLTPPHDILEKKITDYLPSGPHSEIIKEMMRKSYEILSEHPVNKSRKERGLKPANSIWLWGIGKKPALTSFYDKYKLKGSVISAVDLIKGLGICAGMNVVEVEGATGNINTNFEGKARAALKELESGKDFVYIHVEAPDECGHRHEIRNKVKSIELIDEKIVGVIINELKGEEYSIMVLPDHPTPLSLRTHTSDPVPFVIYRSNDPAKNSDVRYDEYFGKESGFTINKGHELMDYFIKG